MKKRLFLSILHFSGKDIHSSKQIISKCYTLFILSIICMYMCWQRLYLKMFVT